MVNKNVSNITENSVQISWNLNHGANGHIEYGTTTSLGKVSSKESNYVQSHSQKISGLTAGTLYYYRIVSEDQNKLKVNSPIESFKTNDSVPVLTPKAPILISATKVNQNYQLVFKQADNASIPDGGYDTYIDNIDQNDNTQFSGLQRTLSGIDIYQKHCFKIQSRYIQPEYLLFESNEICVDASDAPEPDPEPTLSANVTYWKDLFDKYVDMPTTGSSSYLDTSKTYSGTPKQLVEYMLDGKNGNQEYYFLAYPLNAYIKIWQATGDNKYLDEALRIIERTIDDAVPMKGANTGYLGWPVASTFRDYETTKARQYLGIPLWDSYLWRFSATLTRIMYQSPKLRATKDYQAKYEKLLAFTKTHIWERYEQESACNFYRVNTHMASHWARIGMELYIITKEQKYKTVFDNITFGTQGCNRPSNMSSQMKQHSSVSSAYTWSSSWTGGNVQDTSHAGAIVSYIVNAYEQGMYWDKNDIDALVSTSLNVVWKNNNSISTLYVDGSGGDDYAGRFHEWLNLARFSSTFQNKIKAHYQKNFEYYGIHPIGIAALNAKILEDGKPVYPENP